jgi:4-amino-4-deoxy-L-arabinose transferase-like glycosyltransferase
MRAGDMSRRFGAGIGRGPWVSGGVGDIGLLVGALCLGQVLLWGLAFGLSYSAPEIDSAEQFVWAFSLENGYWKHPPLPSWIMHGLIRLFGPSVALPFVATQASIVIALALMWRLGCEFMSPQRSLVAMLLTSLVAYHNLGGDCFNHNTALLPFQAALVLVFYRATRQGRWHQWALAGLFAGLGMLVKYVLLWQMLGLLLYFALDRQLHQRRALQGLLVAAGVFVLVLLPHALWLQSTDFMPFRYARSVAQSLPGPAATLHAVLSFLGIQALRALPFAAGVWFVFRRRGGAAPALEAVPPPSGRDRRFLWCAALSPLAGTLLFSLATETQLQARWGSNGFLLSGWLVLAMTRLPQSAALARRALHFAVGAHLVLCLSMTLSKTVLAEHLHVRTRANFPGAVLAERAQSTWQRHTDAPLRLVVSDIWLGGNLIANRQQPLAVLIDGYPIRAPWVKQQAVNDCGALVLDDQTRDSAGHDAPNPALEALMARAAFTGTWSLPWAGPPAAHGARSQGEVRWGIILPVRQGACSLG